MANYVIKIGSWSGQFSGDQADMWAFVSRRMAKLLPPAGVIPEIRETPDDDPAPVPIAVPPAQTRAYVQADRGTTIVDSDRDRAIRDEQAAQAAGFALAKPLYQIGQPVNSTGVENAAAKRQEVDRMPRVRDSLAELVETIRAERREDLTLDTGALRMNSQGLLVCPDGRRLTFEDRAFAQFCSNADLPAGAGSYLAACDTDLRARNVNNWLTGKASDTWKPKNIKLRVRDGGAVYAAVSEKYACFDVDKIAAQLAESLPSDARGEVFYNGRAFSADVLWNSDVQPEKYVAGEIFRVGLRFRTDDTGGGSCNGSAIAWRNLCLNLIIIDQSTQSLFTLRHLGRIKFQAGVRQGIEKGLDATEHFRRAWGAASDDRIVDTIQHVDGSENPVPRESIYDLMWGAFLAESRRTDAIKRSDVPALVKAWQHEPDPTRVGVVNAVTRAAQAFDPWRADELERYAGGLLRSTKPFQWAPPETRDRNAMVSR